MKKFSMAVLVALTLLSLPACRKVIGEGPVVTENRNTGDFTGINFGVPGQLIYIPGNEFKVEMNAQQNILNVIETYVSNNELRIKVRDNTHIRSNEDIVITVTAPPVTLLGVSGSGSIQTTQHYATQDVEFNVSGSGRIIINSLETGDIKAKISGSGRVQVLDGSARNEDIAVSGSGEIDLLNVLAEKATTHTSGSGTIKINLNDELNAHISGSGAVYYKGNPSVSSSISGSGKIVKL